MLLKLLQKVSNVTARNINAVQPVEIVAVDLEKCTHTVTKKFSISGNWVQRFKYIKFIGGSCPGWSFKTFMSADGFAAKWSNAIIERHALPRWEGFKLLKLCSLLKLIQEFNQTFFYWYYLEHSWWFLRWACLINNSK